MAIKVTVWNEFYHEKHKPNVAEIYPEGLHKTICDFLRCDDIDPTPVSLDMPEQGITDELLESTDVLIWWGHMKHNEVSDELVAKIRDRVYAGKMGFIALHSGHHSKPFRSIVGTTGDLTWGRNQRAVVWNIDPTHPIAKGVPVHFELFEELYSEPFYIPKPDDIIFATWYEDGNLFRGGVTYTRGLGKVFYFHPGHESVPSFHNETVQTIIKNAVHWCVPKNVCDGFTNQGCIHQTEPVITL